MAPSLHRPFFLAALALALTLGATWGASLLWRIGLGQSFTSVGIHEVNAHGQAQVYGWVGLFIMGFAYTVFPRMWRSPAPSRTLSLMALGTTVVGVLAGAIGMRFAGVWYQATAIGAGGGMLITTGAIVFAAQILSAYERRRVAAEPAFLFMLVAVAWFVLSACFSAAYTWMTLVAADHDRLIEVVGVYQAALRDVQIHGMALTMILGVSLKILPGMFGLPRLSQRRALIALSLITLAVAGETGFFLAYRLTDLRVLTIVVYGCWLMLATGVGTILTAWRPCRALPRDDGRSGKFIRAAYVWLAISLVMLLMLPLYQTLVGVPFSHAYYGAVRHAITVGFISMMIMGVASKFVPALRGTPWRDLSNLRGPFILINIGCALRVILQTATDFTPIAFTMVAASGVLEVAALGWWSLDIAGHLVQGRPAKPGLSLEVCHAPPSIMNIPAPNASQLHNAHAGDESACCSACASTRPAISHSIPPADGATRRAPTTAMFLNDSPDPGGGMGRGLRRPIGIDAPLPPRPRS